MMAAGNWCKNCGETDFRFEEYNKAICNRCGTIVVCETCEATDHRWCSSVEGVDKCVSVTAAAAK